MKTQILLLVGLLLNKEIALLRNRDISSDCHMVGSLNTTPRLWSWVSFLGATLCLPGLPGSSIIRIPLGTHSLAGVSCLTAQELPLAEDWAAVPRDAGGQMGPPCSRRLRPPFTRSCPRRSPSFGIFWSVHPKATPSRGLPANHCAPCVGPREPGEPDRPQGPTQDSSSVRSWLRGSRLAHSSPFWEPHSRPKGFRPSLLPCLLPPGSDQKFQPTFRPLPFILRRHFSVSTPPVSSGPLPPRGPGQTPF